MHILSVIASYLDNNKSFPQVSLSIINYNMYIGGHGLATPFNQKQLASRLGIRLIMDNENTHGRGTENWTRDWLNQFIWGRCVGVIRCSVWFSSCFARTSWLITENASYFGKYKVRDFLAEIYTWDDEMDERYVYLGKVCFYQTRCIKCMRS